MHADRALDSGHGSCLLREPGCAALVEEALLRADAERYRLLAWCVMPNHVHVLAEQIEGFPLGDIVQAWKSASAHEINRTLRRKGRLWRREYFDRFMRDDDHLPSTIAYVENNPVAAKLVAAPTDWMWSSAKRRHAEIASDMSSSAMTSSSCQKPHRFGYSHASRYQSLKVESEPFRARTKVRRTIALIGDAIRALQVSALAGRLPSKVGTEQACRRHATE